MPWSAGTGPARLAVPPGAADCHIHIYDGRFPYDPAATLRPAPATVADYRLLQRRLGTGRCVVVQPSSYGTDNACLVDALCQFGDAARGVAVVDASVQEAELRALDAAGVRGARFNLARPAGADAEALEAVARRIAPLGWHLQVHTLPDVWQGLEAVLGRLPVPIVIDHLGRLPQPAGLSHPAWPLLRRLVDEGRAWVKISGAYHDTRSGAPDYADTGAVVRAWVEAAPERVVWGTDWPHPSATAGEKPVPDDARLLDLLADWAPSAALRTRILVDNPVALYGFPEARA
ncbi:amidohydrolase family protein [Roseomonas populi]|uniref:Amidohydrolase family protein n=1 Tax=Roseomonas populi TaxID=3121582 RepID=A0ABT1XBY3_9PROT|nr:amidohydrolase family protein [Roseomonas pecuniae]MCR0985439.1 amidohydrolase family protein [Roseomonas pecuniae]